MSFTSGTPSLFFFFFQITIKKDRGVPLGGTRFEMNGITTTKTAEKTHVYQARLAKPAALLLSGVICLGKATSWSPSLCGCCCSLYWPHRPAVLRKKLPHSLHRKDHATAQTTAVRFSCCCCSCLVRSWRSSKLAVGALHRRPPPQRLHPHQGQRCWPYSFGCGYS